MSRQNELRGEGVDEPAVQVHTGSTWYQGVLWNPSRGLQETCWYSDNHEQFIWYRGQFSENVQVELVIPNTCVILVNYWFRILSYFIISCPMMEKNESDNYIYYRYFEDGQECQSYCKANLKWPSLNANRYIYSSHHNSMMYGRWYIRIIIFDGSFVIKYSILRVSTVCPVCKWVTKKDKMDILPLRTSILVALVPGTWYILQDVPGSWKCQVPPA